MSKTYVNFESYLRAIDWSQVPDPTDDMIWNRVNTNQWLPEKVALRKDRRSWNLMTDEERDVTMKVFVGLTLLDSIQTEIGVPAIMPFATSPFENAVYKQFDYMESVHARSYSTIFMSLATTAMIRAAFDWSYVNPQLQLKGRLIEEAYASGDPVKVRVASVFLESFVFYSGFFWPLYLMTRERLMATGVIIKLIIRDEAVHGFYIGHKFKQYYATLSPDEQQAAHTYATELLMKLYEIEVEYSELLYSTLGLVDKVMPLLHSNANKAMNNLGFPNIFPDELCEVDEAIKQALRTDSGVTHDFFSVEGPSYFMATYEDMRPEDYLAPKTRSYREEAIADLADEEDYS